MKSVVQAFGFFAFEGEQTLATFALAATLKQKNVLVKAVTSDAVERPLERLGLRVLMTQYETVGGYLYSAF